MGIRLSEHKSYFIRASDLGDDIQENPEGSTISLADYLSYDSVISKPFNDSSYRFIFERKESSCEIKADYCIGIDWLGTTGKYLYVEPKINNSSIQSFAKRLENVDENDASTNSFDNIHYELDYLKMLLQVTSISESNVEVKELLQIDWDAPHIPIEQKDDRLTPFLVIRFLQTLKSLVRKGLKKNYYKVQKNLNNQIKGKILVTQHIRHNVLKNKFTSTFCEYQVFGENHLENRFLKKTLQFVISYVENNKLLLARNYDAIQDVIHFCRPAFELISDDIKETELKHIKHNPFYNDYKDALKLGGYILKQFSYTISKTAAQKVTTPPFWIDMPSLFELYVFSKMIEDNPKFIKEIHYQFKTYGNALDILISNPTYQMIIDTKYKLHYLKGHLHQDIRQVAGYARLNSVRQKLKVKDDKNIECLILYPDMKNGVTDLSLENIYNNKEEIKAYHKVYKLGINLPFLKNS